MASGIHAGGAKALLKFCSAYGAVIVEAPVAILLGKWGGHDRDPDREIGCGLRWGG